MEEVDDIQFKLNECRREMRSSGLDGAKKLLQMKKLKVLEGKAEIANASKTLDRLLLEVQQGALERDAQGWLEGLVRGNGDGMKALVMVTQATVGEERGAAACGILLSVLEAIAEQPRLLGAAVKAGALDSLTGMVKGGHEAGRVMQAISMLEDVLLLGGVVEPGPAYIGKG